MSGDQHLALFIIIAVVLGFFAIDLYGKPEAPNFNENPFLGWLATSFVFWICAEIIIWSVRTLFNL